MKAEPQRFSGKRDRIIEAACLSDGIRASLGWRRMQWAVRAPDGGTTSLGSFAMVALIADRCTACLMALCQQDISKILMSTRYVLVKDTL